VGYGTTKDMALDAEKGVIKAQLRENLQGLEFQDGELTIAYEPVWTISKGLGKANPIAPERAAEVIRFIKSGNKKTRVIYGASITSKNAAELAAYPEIEGGLVGGASLDPVEFLGIMKMFNN
jgi:triosephosphate isomerase